MRFPCIVVALVAAQLASPASACMASGPEGYVSGIVWESRHETVPDDAVVLEIAVVESHENVRFALVVEVVDGPEKFAGARINMVPEAWNSCIGLGRINGFVVVRREPVRFEQISDDVFYQAVDYLPASEDRSRGINRNTNWFVPGDPAPKMQLPRPE